jgi:hypothetical protein
MREVARIAIDILLLRWSRRPESAFRLHNAQWRKAMRASSQLLLRRTMAYKSSEPQAEVLDAPSRP